MKRTMIVVVVALMPALLFGMYNIGYQKLCGRRSGRDILGNVRFRFVGRVA